MGNMDTEPAVFHFRKMIQAALIEYSGSDWK